MSYMKRISVWIVLLATLFCGCGKTNSDDDATGKPLSPNNQVRFITYTEYTQYVKTNRIPDYCHLWEDFSALGEFHSATLYKNMPEENVFGEYGDYEYIYIDESGFDRCYQVCFMTLGDTGFTFYDNKIHEEFFPIAHYGEKNIEKYSEKWFVDGDFTKPLCSQTKWILVDDTFLMRVPSSEGALMVYFIYEDMVYRIDIRGPRGEMRRFNSTMDCDIIRRLLNINTYKEAIEELMNPENAK